MPRRKQSASLEILRQKEIRIVGGKKESKKGRGQIKRRLRQERNRGYGVARKKSKIKREKM